MSIVSGNMVFYYMARENLCFLTLCEESYPKRTAFLYLEEVADVILQELLREFGNDVSLMVFTGESSYVCLFDCLGSLFFGSRYVCIHSFALLSLTC